MNTENLAPTVGWLLFVLVIAAPVATRLISNLRTARKIRQHKKNLPGPLLGVVYPEHKSSTIYTRTHKED